ncbi:MAG: hypothetical protein ACYS9X_17830, partial [Planctomycetota bacterium]
MPGKISVATLGSISDATSLGSGGSAETLKVMLSEATFPALSATDTVHSTSPSGRGATGSQVTSVGVDVTVVGKA